MVFYISMIVVSIVVVWGILSPENLSSTADIILNFTISKFGWFYLICVFGFLVFSIYLAFSKYGNVTLGDQNDEPAFSYLSWFGMLFSAGMGIGLVFWGVSEPLHHYIYPPMDIQPGTAEAANTAILYSFFHWGLHAWGIYCTIGLILAYFQFRKKKGSLISNTFEPLIGEKNSKGLIGKTIDILSILATVFGVATSLGLGALQINGGINQVFGIEISTLNQIIIIFVATVLFLISATTGLDKGIKILSNTNIAVAISLLLFVFIFGPTFSILEIFTNTLGSYLQNITEMSLRLRPFKSSKWIEEWTLFYWAWWIAWSPFVGVFIARISKGRTIKEFIFGVLLVPSIFSFLWFSIFGGTALNFQIIKKINLVEVVNQDLSAVLFYTLKELPLSTIISVVAIILIMTFFVSSADSATFVLGMLSSNGSQHPKVYIKIIWGVLQSLIAIALLISGGLRGLQTLAIIAALPFSVILVLMCVSFYKELKKERIIKNKY